MGENLVIVESPAKAKTIEKILGKDYKVLSSFGHIRDLSKKNLGIDIENGFVPKYEVSADKKKVVAELKAESAKAKTVWLASDEDREGEAIAWHLQETLKLDKKNTKRIVFHEITPSAILNAIDNPREVNLDLVMAQQARRVMDRLVGFELSPILWKKIKPSLSAGRVQSVALRLIVEKEREIMDFQAKSYYKVEGLFLHENPEGTSVKIKGNLDKKLSTPEDVNNFLNKCIQCVFTISSIEKKETDRVPAPPFTTSSLQQEASRKYGLPVGRTMAIAQKLYEEGLITYMRTDSTNLSKLALAASKTWIEETFGEKYHKTRQYKTKTKGAQEAHEAIRPTNIARTSITGTDQEKKLYDLIWKRTVASQMSNAHIEKTEADISGDKITEKFIVTGTNILFDGFLKLYMESRDDESENDEDVILPSMKVGENVDRVQISASGKYSVHPARYSEATLVKKMEELGIGRPSTYAPTISTLHQRGYIVRQNRPGEIKNVTTYVLKGNDITSSQKKESFGAEKNRLCPEDIGILVTDFLEKSFPTIMDYGFTAKVEEDFDKIAAGEMLWNKSVESFYKPFHSKVEETENETEHVRARREIGHDPKTGKIVIARIGKFGSLVQLGADDDPDKKFASLDKGQLIETVTLEEAMKLLALPRKVGQYEGVDIICSKGRFGPYLKYGSHNISLHKGMSPYDLTLEDAISLIQESKTAEAKKNIKSFPESDIFILNGRYGPYIKHDGKNFRIPKKQDPESLTLEDCLKIIENSKKSTSKK